MYYKPLVTVHFGKKNKLYFLQYHTSIDQSLFEIHGVHPSHAKTTSTAYTYLWYTTHIEGELSQLQSEM